MSTSIPFAGFALPDANFSKLPHDLIDAFDRITSLSELKVILYVLRHTWGFQDDSKRITFDEFQHGRKRKDGTRIDNGTGMSRSSISRGLKAAEQKGFIHIETDNSDKARVVKHYSLVIQGYQNATAEVAKRYRRGSKTLPRTEKETLERNLQKEPAHAEPKPEKQPEPKTKPEPVVVEKESQPRKSEAKPATAFSPLEKVYRDKNKMLPIAALSKKDTDGIKALEAAGVEPHELADYMDEVGKWWSRGRITMSYIAGNIMAWRETHQPEVQIELREIEDMDAWTAQFEAEEAAKRAAFAKVMEEARLAAAS